MSQNVEQEKQVQTNINPYINQSHHCKTHGTVLVAQIGKRHGCEGIYCHRQGEHYHIVGISRHIHCLAHRTYKDAKKHHEQSRGCCQRNKRCTVHPHWIVAVIVGKTEKTCFHSIGEYYKRQRNIRIQVSYHSIFLGRKHKGVQRHHTPVKKPAYDAAESIYSCVFCKTFY